MHEMLSKWGKMGGKLGADKINEVSHDNTRHTTHHTQAHRHTGTQAHLRT